MATAALVLAIWSGGPRTSVPAAAAQQIPPLPAPTGTVVYVSTEAELQAAVASLASDTTVVIAPGTYRLSSTLYVNGPLTNVTLRGATDRAADVVLVGRGMANANYDAVPHGITTGGDVHTLTVANLTIRDVYNHAIMLDAGAETPRIYNVHLLNAGRQFIKAYSDRNGGGVDGGLVEYTLVEYTATARDADTSGVEVEGGTGWTVRNSMFRNIEAPTGQLTGAAVLMWRGARDSVVDGNAFVNCQREIAFGFENRTPNDHGGGTIANNFIYRDAGVQGSAAILVADSPHTQVLHNTAFLSGTYGSPIEYRFRDTTGVVIRNNLLDGKIVGREGASAAVADNYLKATATLFVNPASGNLHLRPDASAVIDKVAALPEVYTDIDGQTRPQGTAADYGADEYAGAGTTTDRASPAVTESATTTTTSAATSTSTSPSTATSSPTATTTESAPTLIGPAEPGRTSDPFGPLPAPWQSVDFGTPQGSSAWASGIFKIEGGGNDINGNTDQFRFVYQVLEGDGEIVARVGILDRTNVWAKAGVLIRGDLTAGSKYAGGFVSADKGLLFQRRIANGATTTQTTGGSGKAPQWLKLVRAGNLFTAYASRDGSSWTPLGSELVYLGRTAYVGLGVTSKSTRKLATALFDSVVVTSAGSSTPPIGTPSGTEPSVNTNAPPAVQITSPADGSIYQAPASLVITATASDSDGTVSRVEFYAGQTLIRSDATQPFSAAWNSIPAGTYVLTAVARDNAGATTTSSPVTITVSDGGNQPPTVSLTGPAPGATFTAPGSITLTANAADSDGSIAKVEFYAGSTLVGTDTTSPYAVTWSGVPAGTYTLTAKAFDNAGSSTTSGAMNIAVAEPAAGLPAPWATLDIGGTAVAGSASYEAGTFTVKGAGTNIWSTADQFRFVYQPMDGDGEIAACVASLEFVDAWSKAGVMFRDALDADARNAMTLVSAGWGVSFQHRATAAGETVRSAEAPAVAPHCVRLVRQGTQFTAYHSVDGLNWTLMGTQTVAMNSSALVGLAVTSSREDTAARALFNDVSVKVTGSAGAPIVKLTGPAEGATYTAPATVTISAEASDPDGRISRVEFYSGTTLVGSDLVHPYIRVWSNVAAGTYTLTAVAYDNSGNSTTSAPVTISVGGGNQPPVVSLTTPSSGATFQAPADITLTASASDADGTIAKVEFYAGSTLVGSTTSSPYIVSWTNVAAGTYSLTAVAEDNSGATTTSAPVSITVASPNQAPTVSLTAPSEGAAFTAPASIIVSATASDPDGTVAQVDFYAGPTLIGTDVSSPYSIGWSNAPVGSHTLTAVARDNSGATTTSSPVSITVVSSNLPPTVALTAPATGASFTAPATITLSASAADADGSIAKVEFYAGTTLVGTDTTSPYSVSWSNVAAGSYSLTAVAHDNSGARTTSAAISISVDAANQAPTVSITAPSNGATFAAPATITLSASAADSDGSVAKVEFYAGTTLIGTDTTSPYSVSWNNVAAGSYSLTAVAQDNSGARTTSAPVSITVNAPNQSPTVSLTAPSNGATFTAPATITLTASASDSDGSIAKVEFYAGSTLVGTDMTSPYSVSWSNVAAGSYSLTAVAQDNSGARTTSAPVSITVNAPNQPPTVSLTAPANGATFTAPATITLSASASDPDGTVAAVDFYAGSTLLGSDTTTPYSLSWNNVPAGSYALKAVARDNNGTTTTSAIVNITVVSGLPRLLVFAASADHNTAVTGYTVEFFTAGSNPSTATPVRTQNAGKPTPVNGDITVDISATVQALPAGSYFITVTATGSGGTSRSTPTETFAR